MKKWLLLLVFLCCCLGTGWAEISLEIDTTTVSKLAMGKDLAAGYLDYPGHNRLIIESTEPWQLHLRTDDLKFSATRDNYKPVAHLLWRLANQGPYLPLANYDQLVTQGGQGKTQVRIDYRMLLSYLDSPDTYAITLVYTLTSQGVQ